MKSALAAIVTALSALLASCGGGGSGSSSVCNSIGTNTNVTSVSGGVENPQDATDGNLRTFATLSSQAPGESFAVGSKRFQGGSNAGVFLTPPAGFTASDISLSTFLSQNEVTVETATGSTLSVARTSGDAPTIYAFFKTTAPFDGIKLQVNNTGSVKYLVFDFCGSADVR